MKLQKELEEREKVLVKRAKQQEHQRMQLAMESQQLTKVRAEFEAVRGEETRGTGTIVKEAIIKGTVGNMSKFLLKEDWTRWFERLTNYFSECKQMEGQDIKAYLAKLKKLSAHCQFGEQLEIHIRDQFVWGLASEEIRKRFLGELQLTYAKTVEISTSMEMPIREAADMRNAVNSRGNKLNFMDKKKKIVTCYCCGKKGHVSKDCRFKSYACNACGKKGHLEIVCKSKESSKEEKDNSEMLGDIELKVSLKVENRVLAFEIDTGSLISAISKEISLSRLEMR
ncbi:PREDICTED: uncharacterized protein LOC108746634 [Trachymyrmex septentrionalis]|uniref:uncharacterized protein LOC108746634 n=1 Tax=Trachymyrmex septentrionalis TaxID=34720 RepID=UPI00084F8605|nr:PREDICTED: uncharacterized protein LOC108746634 [Trachymyrmex septentrionalis]